MDELKRIDDAVFVCFTDLRNLLDKHFTEDEQLGFSVRLAQDEWDTLVANIEREIKKKEGAA